MKTLRFRRSRYGKEWSEVEPKWHIAAKAYDPKEFYNVVSALCGYETRGATAMIGLIWSNAVRRPKGKHCKTCIATAAQRAKEPTL